MNAIENRRLKLQDELDAAKSQKQRNQMGQFATPTPLASTILDFARGLIPPATKVRFLDPAIGTGSFYSALQSHFAPSDVESAVGFEIDPHYGLPAASLWKDSPLDLRLADFTTALPPPASELPNLIICNPPYVRHHHLGSAAKKRMSELSVKSTGIATGGLAGLYCYFMAIAHEWLADEGLAAWLIPSEFMDVNYGSSVRRYLSNSVELIRIHRFDPAEMQFGDAQVSSAIVWFRKRRPAHDQIATMSFGGTLADPKISREVSLNELRGSEKWTGLAQQASSQSNSVFRLADLFRIKRGLATGNNDLFVFSEGDAARLNIPSTLLRPLLPSPRYLPEDIVRSDSDGIPLLSKRQFLFDCDLNEEELLRTCPQVAEYLAAGREQALSTYICSRRTPWYSQEVRPAAPIVCTYMGRGLKDKKRPFRFILNNSRATALNVYLMLYPTKLLSEALAANPQLIVSLWEALNRIPSEALLGEGRVYGGGLYKMEPKELANLPADHLYRLIAGSIRSQESQIGLFGEWVA
jgi:hypothetical protein